MPDNRWSRLVVLATFLALIFSFAGVTADSGSQAGRAQETLIAESLPKSSPVKAYLVANVKQVACGKEFRLGVRLVPESGWHTYYKESGQAGMPTKVEWELPAGFTSGELLWQRPARFEDAGIVTYGYNGQSTVAALVKAPDEFKAAGPVVFKARVKWLSCKEACLPGKAEVELSLPVVASGEKVEGDNEAEFAAVNFNGPASEVDKSPSAASGSTGGGESILDRKLDIKDASAAGTDIGLLSAFGAAFLGGMILNLMPCVLPVISIKIFSLMQSAGDDSKKVFEHGMVFTAGILASFAALGGLVIAIQGAGQKIGWGFQFQYPVFVFLMACIVTVFTLAMFGAFYIAVTAGQSEIDRLASSEGLGGTFFKGVLATLLSTPCSAPFLGTALGFAFSQPGWLIMSIFLTIGLGMASPYILLCAKPGWMKYLPKPGTWMERFKESMGFLLLATVVWLISVLGKQVGFDAAIAAISFLVVLSFASWLVGAMIDLTSSTSRKIVVWSIAAATLGAGWLFFLKPHPVLLSTDPAKAHAVKSGDTAGGDGIAWKPFTAAALDQLLNQKKTVFLDFTAEWCLTCKANEATIIATPPVIEKMKALNVVPVKADWTSQDPEITKMLAKFGRSGVPAYVIFPAGKPSEPILLPEAINQAMVLEKLQEAGPSQ